MKKKTGFYFNRMWADNAPKKASRQELRDAYVPLEKRENFDESKVVVLKSAIVRRRTK